MFRDSLRRMLGEMSPPKVVRQMENDPKGYPDALWTTLSEMGLPGLCIDEQYGGIGMGALETAILYEELGRTLAPTPHFVSSILCAGLIARLGSEEQKQKWLPAIASGAAVAAPAWFEPGGGFGPEGVQLAAVRSADGYTLSGRKHLVSFALAADVLLVLVRTGEADEAIDILLVDPKAPGVTLTQQPTMASDAQYEVTFKNVVVPMSARLGESGWGHWQAVLTDGMIALAAWAVGCGDRALEMAVDYAKERVQFDRLIGSFQGIAHPLADAATAIEGARLLAYEAAWARDTGRSFGRLAVMAHVQAADAARMATRTGQQTLGGIGFTVDIDMQLYYRRAKQNQLAWGDVGSFEELIAADVLGEEMA
jgi:alkylation response protein AidB-like acyl-CoA dehydrogenase